MEYIHQFKRVGFLRVVSFSLGILFLSTSVSIAAHYNGQCSTDLNTVESTIESADFLGKRGDTDRSRLLAKLDAADGKITLLKYSDAIGKLGDIYDKATTLAAASKPKLTDSDAAAIKEAVGNAISCVGAL